MVNLSGRRSLFMFVLGALLACAFALGLPAQAFAAVGLIINGEDAYNWETGEPITSGPGWTWDGANNLTLDGYNGAGITFNGDLTITLKGSNVIKGTNNTYELDDGSTHQYAYWLNGYPVYTWDEQTGVSGGTPGDITICGPGTLAIDLGGAGISDSDNSFQGGLVCESGKLVIDGASVSIARNGMPCGVSGVSAGDLTLQNGASLDIDLTGAPHDDQTGKGYGMGVETFVLDYSTYDSTPGAVAVKDSSLSIKSNGGTIRTGTLEFNNSTIRITSEDATTPVDAEREIKLVREVGDRHVSSYTYEYVDGEGETHAGSGYLLRSTAGPIALDPGDPIDISSAEVGNLDQPYAFGEPVHPGNLSVTLGSANLSEPTDYYVDGSAEGFWDSLPTEVGQSKTVTLVGNGKYGGTKQVTYKVVPRPISWFSISSVADQTYDGKAKTPKPTVSMKAVDEFGEEYAITLKEGTDYTLSYKNNVNVGTATITVTGKGNYTGTKTATFKIVAADISKASVSAVADQTYTGKAITPKPTVKVGSATLKEGTDYTLSYKNNTKVGTATITVTGKGNYTGTTTATFKIVAAPEPVADAVPVYRLYNKKTSEHLYTLNKNEYDQLPKITKGDWVQEGIAWYAPKTSKSPVYRLYNKRSGDHHYTTDQHERDVLVDKHGWTSEGIAFYSDDAKRLPLYRVYNSRLQRGQHHYTADANERKVLTTKHGWVDENIGFYGVKAK